MKRNITHRGMQFGVYAPLGKTVQRYKKYKAQDFKGMESLKPWDSWVREEARHIIWERCRLVPSQAEVVWNGRMGN